jgi:hypothetical protein
MGSLRPTRSDAEIRQGSLSHCLVVGRPKSCKSGLVVPRTEQAASERCWQRHWLIRHVQPTTILPSNVTTLGRTYQALIEISENKTRAFPSRQRAAFLALLARGHGSHFGHEERVKSESVGHHAATQALVLSIAGVTAIVLIASLIFLILH